MAESDKVMGQGPFDMKYFLSGALAGGICCSLTRGAASRKASRARDISGDGEGGRGP